jgi:hypothetical protein
LPKFDHRSDVTQLGTVALSLILGRQLHEEEGPSRLGDLVSSAWAVSARGGLEPLPAGLRAWMMCALQLDARNSFESAIDAQEELERVLGESDYLAAPASLEAFLDRYRAATRPASAPAAPEPVWPIHVQAQEPPHASVPEAKSVLDYSGITQPLASQPVLGQAPMSRAAARPVSLHEPDVSMELTPIATPTPSAGAVRPPSSGRVPVAPKVTPAPSVIQAAAPAPAPVHSSIPAAPAVHPTSSMHIPASTSVAPIPSATAFEQLSTATARKEPDLFSMPLDVSPFENPPKAQDSRKRWGLIAAGIAVVAVAAAGVPAARRFVTPNPAANDGILIMTTNPPGAKLFVDGVERGITPLSVSLKAGAHALEVRGDGPARVMPIAMTAGAQLSQYIELPKSALTAGQLQVRTEPSGARVSIDGVPRGVSPVTVPDLTPGEHAVSLESDRGSVKQIVAIEAGITASLMVPLGAATDGVPVSGWIAVTAPADVQVFENKRLIGSSQSDRLMVSAGRHDVEIVNETLGYRTSRTIQVAPGKVSPIKIDFPKGTIALNALPWAEVWVDGEKVGDTPIGNLSLTIGSHEIVFRHPDLGEQRHAATVTLTSPARLSVDLRKK